MIDYIKVYAVGLNQKVTFLDMLCLFVSNNFWVIPMKRLKNGISGRRSVEEKRLLL